MKLIDLLVQELPKQGGWPPYARKISMHADGNIYINGCYANRSFTLPPCDDGCSVDGDFKFDNSVNRNQYESALAVSQQPVWSGEGMPPVGCECEFYNDDYDVRPSCPKDGQIVKIVAHQKSKSGLDLAVFTWTGERNGLHAEVCTEMLFRPIRTEAERKRDEATDDIASLIGSGTFSQDAESIYDAIAAGKIPGVKLE
jgi:hypothetical protein